MNRKTLVSIHLYLAAFFTPMVLLVAISGGLYLFGVKGSVERTTLTTLEGQTLDMKASDLHTYTTGLLQQAGVEGYQAGSFKTLPDGILARPSTRQHYQFTQTAAGIDVVQLQPDLFYTLIELHKGHGPEAFRWLEKIFALALVFIMLSGLWLGLQSPLLKQKTVSLAAAGVAVMVLLATLF